MRKSLIAAAILLCLSIALLPVGTAIVSANEENVQMQQITSYGDESALKDVVVSMSVASGKHLYWNTDFYPRDPEKTNTTFDFSISNRENAEEGDLHLSMDCPISFGSSTTANAGFNFSATDDIPLKKAVVDVASRTAADSVHRETVRLADYYEYLPLEMYFAGGIVFEDAEEVDALSSFFRVRTPDALRITLEITKNALGGVTDIECSTTEDTAPQLSSNLSAMVGNILYLSPPCWPGARADDYASMPDGFGIYRLSLEVQDAASDRTVYYPMADSLEIVYPLNADEVFPLALQVSEDQHSLLFFYKQEDRLMLTVLDLDSMEPIQTLECLTEVDDPYVWQIYEGENFLLIALGSGDGLLLSKDESGTYSFAFALDSEHFQDIYFGQGNAAFCFDGKRLFGSCFESIGNRRCELYLCVLDQNGLICESEYRNSLEIAETNDYTLVCKPAGAKPLRITPVK